MQSPIDYTSAFQGNQFLSPIMGGIQMGAQLANAEQYRLLREQRENELAFRQGQALLKQEEDQRKAAQMQALRVKREDIVRKRAEGTLTAQDLRDHVLGNIEFYSKDQLDQFNAIINSMSQEDTKKLLATAAPILSGTLLNKPQLIQYLEAIKQADIKAIPGMDMLIKNLESGEVTPEAFKENLLSLVAAVPGTKDAVDNYLKVENEKRARLLAPAELAAKERAGMPDDIKTVQAYGSLTPEQQKKFDELQAQKAKPLVSIGSIVGAPKEETTDFQKGIARKASEAAVNWRVSESAVAYSNIAQLKAVVKQLEKDPGLTGAWQTFVPSWAMPFFAPRSTAAREDAERVIQVGMRAVLGQFTADEGKMFLKRAFNPELGVKENARRLKLIVAQMEASAEQMEAMAKYGEDHGSLVGYKGRAPNIADFEKILEPRRASGQQSRSPAPPTRTRAEQELFNRVDREIEKAK